MEFESFKQLQVIMYVANTKQILLFKNNLNMFLVLRILIRYIDTT